VATARRSMGVSFEVTIECECGAQVAARRM
jgi:hypothetical protein